MTDGAPIYGEIGTPMKLNQVSFETSALSTRDARARWNDTFTELYCEADVRWPHRGEPHDANWSGNAFGDLHVSNIHAAMTHTVIRSPAMIRSDGQHDYLLIMLTEGFAQVTQADRTATIEQGTFVIVDCAVPFEYHSPEEFRQIVVHVPRQSLTARLPEHIIAELATRPIGGGGGAGRLVTDVLKGIVALGADLSPGSATALSSSALDMLAVAVAETPASMRTSGAAHHRDLTLVKQALQRNIHNADYLLPDLAAEVGMSPRYIQKLFAETGATPRNWLQQARLERARNQLLTTDLTLADIATQIGYRDVSHFSRSFRARFAVSPGQYRTRESGRG